MRPEEVAENCKDGCCDSPTCRCCNCPGCTPDNPEFLELEP